MQQTRLRILEYLQAHGEGIVETLAAEIGLAPVTVRHHLMVLRKRGLLEIGTESVGRGRPRHVYRLSPKGGRELCAGKQYVSLAASLLGAIKHRDDEAGSRFFIDMAVRVAEHHRADFEGRPIEERLDVAVDLLGQCGYSARWEADGEAFLVHELGCPYEQLSEIHDDVCCLDLELIQRVTGREVARESWRREGSAACTYRVIAPATGVREPL